MDLRPLTSEIRPAWDAFAAASADAWFWHTSAWLDWTRELAGDRFIADRSFVIVADAEPLAICPLMVERGPYGTQFSMMGEPIPFLAIKAGVGTAGRQRLIARYVDALAAIAGEVGAQYVRVKLPFLRAVHDAGGLSQPNPLLRFGFFDLPYLTHLIDLRPDLEALWADVRKGHRADIKRARETCAVTIWDQRTISTAKMREYQALHAKDAGRITRSQKTFDMMQSWIASGHAVLVEGHHHDAPVSFAVILLHGRGAYYGSGCTDPDRLRLCASHMVQWEAIAWLKASGYVAYDVGVQHFAPQWFEVPSAKDVSIAEFKRGFGGGTVPLITAECFYSMDAMRQAFAGRLERYLAAVPAQRT
jgi:hypothetical protein